MTQLDEAEYPGHFLLGDDGYRSREVALLQNGSGAELRLPAGLVLAKTAVGGASVASKAGGNTGTGTVTLDPTTPALPGSKPGVYALRCIAAATNGGVFRVEDPNGFVIGDVAVGATFSDDIKFVVADGATDFVVGDGFDVTVAPGVLRYLPFTNATDLPAAAVLYDNVVLAAGASARATAIVRDAEVRAAGLRFDASLSGAQLTAARAAAFASLAALGIGLR